MIYRIAILCITASLLAACGGNVSPIVTPASSALRPDKSATSLLYIGDLGEAQVDVLSYPQGKPQFTISGFGSVNGLCTDSSGDVWVSDGHNGKLLEYAYGSKKVKKTLTDTGFYMQGCAVDPKSGDVAVAIQAMNSDPGGVAIFDHAKGKPLNITAQAFYFPSFCTYDSKSDLFLDGNNVNGMFFLAELPKGSQTLRGISLPQQIEVTGGVQWDGKNVVVDDQGAGYKGSTLYEFSISGSTATETGTTQLGGSSDVISFALDGKRVIGPNIGQSPNVMYWPYPAGGQSTKTLTGFTEPTTAVVDTKP
jgi:hypothetical protein